MSMNDWKTMSADRHDNDLANVREFQEFANAKFSHLWGKKLLKVDGIFGKNTDRAAESIQRHLLLVADGIVGPKTIHWLKSYKRNNRILLIPDKPEVKVLGGYWSEMGGWTPGDHITYTSTFGGPHDDGDNMYGQAYIRGYDRPSALASHNPELMDMGILRSGIATLGQFPMVKFFDKKDADGQQVYVRAGTSWALNPKSFFCAIRTEESYDRIDEENPVIAVINPKNGKVVFCLRVDKGPSRWLGTKRYPGTKPRSIDLSDGAMDALEADPDDGIKILTDRERVIWGWAAPGSTIGYKGQMPHPLI